MSGRFWVSVTGAAGAVGCAPAGGRERRLQRNPADEAESAFPVRADVLPAGGAWSMAGDAIGGLDPEGPRSMRASGREVPASMGGRSLHLKHVSQNA